MTVVRSRVKRLAKPPVTAALFTGGYYRRLRSRLPGDRAVILTYHHVGGRGDGWWAPFQQGVPRARFEAQIRFLCRAMTPVSLRQVVEAVRGGAPLPPRAVAVTFDDGYLDNYTEAYPVLRRHGIPATVFVTTGFIDGDEAPWWEQVYRLLRLATAVDLDLDRLARVVGCTVGPRGRRMLGTRARRVHAAEAVVDLLRTLPAECKAAGLDWLRAVLAPVGAGADAGAMMTWSHLREMAGGGVAVESHTHSHRMLGLADAATVGEELARSRDLIARNVGAPPEGVAYPDGRAGMYTPETVRLAAAAGYRWGCIALPTPVRPGADPFTLGRAIAENVPLAVFVRDLLRAYVVRDGGGAA